MLPTMQTKELIALVLKRHDLKISGLAFLLAVAHSTVCRWAVGQGDPQGLAAVVLEHMSTSPPSNTVSHAVTLGDRPAALVAALRGL